MKDMDTYLREHDRRAQILNILWRIEQPPDLTSPRALGCMAPAFGVGLVTS